MRLPFWLRPCRRDPPAEPAPAPVSPVSLADVTHARALSENGLRDAYLRDRHVQDAARSLRRLRDENHFAEAMQRIFRERHT